MGTRASSAATVGGAEKELFVYLILNIRQNRDSRLLISSQHGRKTLMESSVSWPTGREFVSKDRQ